MDDDEDDGSGPADIYGQENEDEQMEDTDAQLDALLSQEAEEEEDIKEAMFKAVDAAAKLNPEAAIQRVPINKYVSLDPRDRIRECYKPFVPPAGAPVRPPGAPRVTWGVRRRRPGDLSSLNRPMVKSNITPPDLAGLDPSMLSSLAASASDAAEAAKLEAEAQAAKGAPLVLPPGYTPLVLYDDGKGHKVQVEDFLGVQLRPHQREGLAFMWQCIHGVRGVDRPGQGQGQGQQADAAGGAEGAGTESREGAEGGTDSGRPVHYGCLLADDMGLGKTFQSIALIYTVTRQGIIPGTPTARRVVVVAPSSVLHGWGKDVKKFLGDRLRLLILADKDQAEASHLINSFLTKSSTTPVLVISYESYRKHYKKFCAPGACDLVICDEAHRLKNDATQLNQALSSIACTRRVMLTGTPVQNNLDEFYAMMEFTCPGCLGDPVNFRKRYALPIDTGRESSATDAQKAAAARASAELTAITGQFVLRRMNTILMKYLPPKRLAMVIVRLSPLQEKLRACLMEATEATRQAILAAALDGEGGGAGSKKGGSRALELIILLRKLIAHPRVLYEFVASKMRCSKYTTSSKGPSEEASALYSALYSLFPPDYDRARIQPSHGGKFYLCVSMMARWRRIGNDRVVLVSGFTETLDCFEKHCQATGWSYVRLDGAVPAKKRSEMINKFNDPAADCFLFMLSTRAGGAGINLPGGNRLILYDPDWNPANDLQAAGRVHRDGQRKKVHVYRLFATGTLEEKILQRQLSKKGMQTTLVEGGEEKVKLDSDDLKRLFDVCPDNTDSDTHDMLRCARCRKAELEAGESDVELEAQAKEEAALRGAVAQEAHAKVRADGSKGAGAGAGQGEEDMEEQARPVPVVKKGGPAKGRKKSGKDESEVVMVDEEEEDEDVPVQVAAGKTKPGGVICDDDDEDEDIRPGVAAAPTKPSPAASVSSRGSSSSSSSGSSSSLSSSSSSSSSSEGEGSEEEEVQKAKRKAPVGAKRRAPRQGVGRAGGGRGMTKKAAVAEKRSKREEAAVFQALYRSKAKANLAPVPPGTYRRQLKAPAEEDLMNWSHHTGTAGIGNADEVLAVVGAVPVTALDAVPPGSAAAEAGVQASSSSSADSSVKPLVSFCFGLEVSGRDLAEVNREQDEKARTRAVEEAKEARQEAAAAMAARMKAVTDRKEQSAKVQAMMALMKAGSGGAGVGAGVGVRGRGLPVPVPAQPRAPSARLAAAQAQGKLVPATKKGKGGDDDDDEEDDFADEEEDEEEDEVPLDDDDEEEVDVDSEDDVRPSKTKSKVQKAEPAKPTQPKPVAQPAPKPMAAPAPSRAQLLAHEEDGEGEEDISLGALRGKENAQPAGIAKAPKDSLQKLVSKPAAGFNAFLSK